MTDYAAQLPQHTLTVVEATGNWSHMYAVLKPHVETVVLAHPKQVRAIAAAKVKIDKIDAAILAHLARAELLPAAYALPVRIKSYEISFELKTVRRGHERAIAKPHFCPI